MQTEKEINYVDRRCIAMEVFGGVLLAYWLMGSNKTSDESCNAQPIPFASLRRMER